METNQSVRTHSIRAQTHYLVVNGTFEKLKARLVAEGDRQDRSLYEDLSAPKVLTSSVFSIAAVAAMENRHFMVVDTGGVAFLNVLHLDPIMSKLMTDMSPEYRRYTSALRPHRVGLSLSTMRAEGKQSTHKDQERD